jgi:hypothetical protein
MVERLDSEKYFFHNILSDKLFFLMDPLHCGDGARLIACAVMSKGESFRVHPNQRHILCFI